jgi:succinoglycan biosynthesis transport protein ExoP
VSEKIDEMRKQIFIESIGANVKTRRQGQGTIAFKLSFEHRKPEITQRVANDLVTLFLDENVKSRTERATETTEFLTQEADKLKSELEKVETQLAAYKQEHSKRPAATPGAAHGACCRAPKRN